MSTFSEMKHALDEIASENVSARNLIVGARKKITRAQSDLAAMPGNYSGLSAEIDQAAIDNPANEGYQVLKSEKDNLASDFVNLKSYADNLITAYDSVSE